MDPYRGENRRRFVRYNGAAKATVPREGQEDLSGRLHNISHNGAGLRLPEPLEVGQSVSVSLVTPRMERLKLTGEVIHNTSDSDGQYLVGIKLDEWLAPEKLEELRSMR